MAEHEGNPVKVVFNPETGISSNFIATSLDIPVPDRKNDYLHGHYDVNEQGQIGYHRDPGEKR
jgi:hypothetical protein